MKRIAPEIWRKVRLDYVHGVGSVAVVAEKHGLRFKTVEKCAAREHWTTLRREFEARQLAHLSPAGPPAPETWPCDGQLRQDVRAFIGNLLAAAERQQQRILSRLKNPAMPAAERQQCADDYLDLCRDWLSLNATAAKWNVFPDGKSADAGNIDARSGR